LLAAARRQPLKIWEIQLTQIARAFGDKNLAGDDATRVVDASRCPRLLLVIGFCA